jgi:hypothetical protein
MYIHEENKSIDSAEEVVVALNNHYKSYLSRYPETPNSFATHYDPINSLLTPETERPQTCKIDCTKCSATFNDPLFKDLKALQNLSNNITNRESLKQLLEDHHHPNYIVYTSYQFQKAKEHLIAHINYAHSSH